MFDAAVAVKGTEWEPYISVALCSGVALAFTMTLSGVLNLLGSS